MPIEIETLVLGPVETNCYVIVSGDACWIVDPGPAPGPLMDWLRARGIAPQRILITHGHGDHIAGVEAVRKAYPSCRIYCPAGDARMLDSAALNMSAMFGMPVTSPPADEFVTPGQTMELGDMTFVVLDTSGHTPGGVSYYSPQAGVVFTGDALFARSIGRTDLPGASEDKLLDNIRRYLLTLPDVTVVYPGHGPATTIGAERSGNMYLLGS